MDYFDSENLIILEKKENKSVEIDFKITSNDEKIISDLFKIIIMGKSGIGKSKFLNMLYHKTTDTKAMKNPATVSDKTTGETEGLKGYIDVLENVLFIDSVGLTDNRCNIENLIIEFKRLIRNIINGVNVLFFCLPYGRYDTNDRANITMLKKIWGENILKNICLVIHSAPKKVNFENWLKTIDSDLSFLMETKDVVFINNMDDNDDNEYIIMRQNCINKFKYLRTKNKNVLIKPIGGFVQNIIDFIMSLFPKLNTPNYMKLFKDILTIDKMDCSICLEPIIDDRLITICYHHYHNKCNDYLKNKEQCPICRIIFKKCAKCFKLIFNKDQIYTNICGCVVCKECSKDSYFCILCGKDTICFVCEKPLNENYFKNVCNHFCCYNCENCCPQPPISF